MSRRQALAATSLATLAALAILVAGCGGGGKQPTPPPPPTEQAVKGAGFTYVAPVGWKVFPTANGVNASGPGSRLLSVAVYKLVKRYNETKFVAAARELDGVAARLAQGRKGAVTARATVTVAGRRARSYAIAYTLGADTLIQQVTFVLRGTTEWLLVCRRATADPDAPCAKLLSSFTLAAAR